MRLPVIFLTVIIVPVIGGCAGADTETVLPVGQSAAEDRSADATSVRSRPVLSDRSGDDDASSETHDQSADTATQLTQGPVEIPPATAAAITRAPTDISSVNDGHDLLRAEGSRIRFGTQADPATVTLGPTDGGHPRYPPYDGKNSLNIKMPLMTPVLAPLDVRFVGFKNRSARYRQDTQDSPRLEPFDDLELCFESVTDEWPGLVLCVYHLHTTPLLRTHLEHEACDIQEKWDGGGAEAGRIYYLQNTTELSRRHPESCEPRLGSILNRGAIIGYSGQVGNNPHVGFRFKVRSTGRNPLTVNGDPYLHWVQPSSFFYWQCFERDVAFQSGVLSYPFDCKLIP
jgi:hypothetical protein